MTVSSRLCVANRLCFEGNMEQKGYVVVCSHKVEEELDVLGNVGDGIFVEMIVGVMSKNVQETDEYHFEMLQVDV